MGSDTNEPSGIAINNQYIADINPNIPGLIVSEIKHEKRVKIANRGTTDVSELLAKMKEAKAKSSMGEKAVSLED